MATSDILVLPIFIPFAGCPHRCVFCDQPTLTGEVPAIDLERCGRSIEDMIGHCQKNCSEVELAFYGGSFTALPMNIQEKLLDQAAPFLEKGNLTGLRISTRPDSIDSQRLEFLKERGVTSIELGAQSMDDNILSLSERGHRSEETMVSAKLIKKYRFRLGLQMMTGLPGDSLKSSLETALILADLKPSMVRIYPTLVIEGTVLEKMWRKGEYRPWTMMETLQSLSFLIPLFRSRSIKIIRIGLHLDRQLQDGNKILAGPVHPSLGALARERVIAGRMEDWCSRHAGRLSSIIVNPRELPQYLGEKRKILEDVRRFASNPRLTIQPDHAIPPGWFEGR